MLGWTGWVFETDAANLNEDPLPGEPPAATPDEVEAAIHRLGAADAFWLLDSGPLPPSAPSTVVDCAADPPGVLRPGAIPVTELRAVVPDIEEAGRE